MSEWDRLNLAQCYSYHDGKWPKDLDVSGVMFWQGQRIVKADFRAIKRDGIQSDRFK